MNILTESRKKIEGRILLRTVLKEEYCTFSWNEPASLAEIEAFEEKHQCRFPKTYREFLLTANGATLFKSDSGNSGYRLLSLQEMEEATAEMKEYGYTLSDQCICFLQFLSSADQLFFDFDKKFNSILDGNMRIHAYKWEYINTDINTFFQHLFECNGEVYWRW